MPALTSRKRKSATLPQLSFPELGTGSRPDLDPTPPLARHPSATRVLEKVRFTRAFFPELDGISIRVGLTRAAAGFASREEFWVWMNPTGLTLHTVAHELTHLVQNLGTLPKGEKSADLFALARHRTLVDEVPCYLRTPRSLRAAWSQERGVIERFLFQTAQGAVAFRNAGGRTYLRWFETELERRWQEHQSSRATKAPPSVQIPISSPRPLLSQALLLPRD